MLGGFNKWELEEDFSIIVFFDKFMLVVYFTINIQIISIIINFIMYIQRGECRYSIKSGLFHLKTFAR